MALVSAALHGFIKGSVGQDGMPWPLGEGGSGEGGGGGCTDMQPIAFSHACMHTKRNGYISLDGHIEIRGGLSYQASPSPSSALRLSHAPKSVVSAHMNETSAGYECQRFKVGLQT